MGTFRRFQDEGYKNWIKTSLGLAYLKTQLGSFLESETESYHQDIQKIIHWNGQLECLQKCKLKESQPKTSKVRPNVCDVCAPWRDEIWKNHKGGQVYWNNFSPYLWPKNKWEVAKVYMPRGNSTHNSTDTFDISAFLNLMSNCLHFKRFAKNALLTQVTNVRNNIMHNANFEVKAEQLKEYLDRIRVLGKALEEHAPGFQILDKEIDELQNLDFTVIMSAMETKVMSAMETEPSVHTESEECAKRFLSMELDIMKEKMECLAQEYEGDKENMLKPEELQCVRQFLEENKDLKESLVPQWERLKEVQEQHGQQIDSLTDRVDELEKNTHTSDPEWDTDIRMYKNHLFEYARKYGWTEPVFTQIPESTGFRGQVSIKNQTFTGTRVHRGKRQADQEVAKIAHQQLVKETPSEQGDEDTSVSQTQQSESVSAAGSTFFGSVTVGLDVTVFSDEGGGGIESAYRKLMPVFGLELSGPGSSYKDAVVQYCLRRDVPAPEEMDKSDCFTLRLKGPITFYDSESSSKRKQAQQQAAKAVLRGLSGVLGKKEVSNGNYIGALKELLDARKLEGVRYDVTERPVSSGEREGGLRNQESQRQGAERQRERESGQATEETINYRMPGRDGRIEDAFGSCRISETPTVQPCQSPKSQLPLQPHATETQTATALSEERSVSGDGGRFLGCVKVPVKKELEPAEALSQEGAVQAAYSSLLNALCLGPTTGLDGGDRRDAVLEFFTRSKCRPPVEKLETTDHGKHRCTLTIDGELTFYSPERSPKKQQAEQWAAKEALRCLVGLLGGKDSNLSGEMNYKGRLQELLAKQGSTAMIEYSFTDRATVSTVAAPVQVSDSSAVIGQQAGVPSVIPPVTMDTAFEDSAPPPAKMIQMDDMPVRDGRIEDAVASCRISESPKSQVPLQPHATETQPATASSEEISVSGDGGRFLGCVKVTVKKELEPAEALSQEGAVQAAYSSLLNALCLGPTTGLAGGDRHSVLEFFTRSKCRHPVEKLETTADGKHRCTLTIDGELTFYSPEGSSRKQQAEQWAAKEALRCLVGLLGGKDSNLSGETNYKGRLQELLAKQGSTAMIEYSFTDRETVSTVAAPVQVPDGSAVIGPGQQSGVPSVIPPVTMDTASEDSASPPAKKPAKSPADGPMEEIRQFLPMVSVKPGTVVCESVNLEEEWECRVSVSLERFTFQDHRPFSSKKDASHNAYLTLGCAGQICQPDESKVKEKVNQHFSQSSFPLPKDVYKQPEPLKFCCSLTNITCVFTYTGTDSSEASARHAAFRTALSCVSPLMGFPLATPTRAEETEHRLKTLLETAACVNTTTDRTSALYRSSAMLTFAGFCMETVGEGSKKETQSRLSQRLLRLLQGPDTASTSKDQSMRNSLQEWFQQRGLGMPVFEDTDGKFGTRITFSAPLCLYSDWQDSHETAGRTLVDELKRRF